MDAQEFKGNNQAQDSTTESNNPKTNLESQQKHGLSEVEAVETKLTRQEEILELYNTCCICGSDLYFNHRLDYALHAVAEESHCPTCGIRNKEINHILH